VVLELAPETHEILTGSRPDGTAGNAQRTCNNWTSSGPGSSQVGYADRKGPGDDPNSWNSAHPTWLQQRGFPKVRRLMACFY